MAKAAEIAIAPDEPYRAAAARIVRVRAQELFEQAGGVLDVRDIERVHDMRVASRRLRAVLEIFAPCFPPDQHERVLGEVKTVADALGERRDADVTIAAIEGFAAGLTAPDRPGVASLVEQIRLEQEQANAELEPFVESGRLAGLSERLSELVSEAEALAAEGPS